MKINPLCLLLFLLFGQCSPDRRLAPEINYEQASIELMKELQPKLTGQWTIQLVNLKHQDYNVFQKQLKIIKDTSFVDFATLTIIPTTQPRTTPRDLRIGEYDGTIQFGSKTYPIQFNLLAGSGWITRREGPQGVFMLLYKFPLGAHIQESEEQFLEKVGLVGDSFTLELTPDSKEMVWRGLNRGLDRIELTKR